MGSVVVSMLPPWATSPKADTLLLVSHREHLKPEKKKPQSDRASSGVPTLILPQALIRRPRLGAMTHDVLGLLVVNFCDRVVCLTMSVQ